MGWMARLEGPMSIRAAASPEARVSAVVVERSDVPMPVRMTSYGC